jgi:hypothetical protein
VLLLFFGIRGLTAQPGGRDPVTLPAYIVVDSHELPPPEKWLYTRIGGLEIISSASERTTRHLVREFERFCQALALVWPDVQRASARPSMLIICGRGGEFQTFAPPTREGRPPALIAMTLRDPDRSAIVLDLATPLLSGGDTVDDEAITFNESRGRSMRAAGDRYRQLYRAYVRFLLASTKPRAPAWFEEGLAQLLMSIRITDRDVTVGALQNPNEILEADGAVVVVQDLDFNAVLRGRRLVPMKTLLEMSHDSYEAENATGNMWSKQSYAFVHWGLYGEGGRHQKAFVTFLARLAKQPLSEDLFKRTFQQSYDEIVMTLLSYAELTSHRIAGVEAEKGYKLPLPSSFELRDATESEAMRIKGEALLAGGKFDHARATMAAAYRRGAREPDLLASIGLLELRANETATAKKFLELAASGKTSHSRALVELAKLRLVEALGPEASTPCLGAAQVVAVLTPLFAARDHPSEIPELYVTIARAWEKSVVNPQAEHLAVLDEGLKLYPTETELIYMTATLKARIGLYAEAGTLVTLGLRQTADATRRSQFLKLQAALTPFNSPADALAPSQGKGR